MTERKTTKRPKRKPKRKIFKVSAVARADGKHSAVDIAAMVRQLDDDWRKLASDAISALGELANACGTATPMIDIRERGKRSYWGYKRRLDELSGQLEMFR
jgi:hypothetical protein